MSTPRWPCVIFDLDGTLVDTVPLIVASYQHTFRTHLGHEEDEARIKAWIGQPLIRAFREVDPDLAEDMYATYLAWNLEHSERLLGRFEGVPEMLRALNAAGVHTGIATSKKRSASELALQLTGLADLIPLLVTMEDTSVHKPDPTPLLMARAALHVPDGIPTAYVGDAAVDIQAGQAAGMATVAVTWGAGTREALAAAAPDDTATTVAQLQAILLP